ncbi:MAG: aminoglycoside phosphotransferase family protein [Maricaulaceae bacterium]
MSDRSKKTSEFLAANGWGKADRTPVPGDASTRRYERLTMGGERAVLMDAPRAAEAPGEPEGASVEDRRALGYNALARLAGPDPAAFVCIASELTRRGFSAPNILAADLDEGFILLEDFGQDVYARVVSDDPSQEALLYKAAVDTMAAIYRSTFPHIMSHQRTTWHAREYDSAALLAETDLCLDWYVKDADREISEGARAEFYGLWEEAFKVLGAHASGFALRDFHAENLFWLPERQAVSRVGLIDFQDGLFVHPAYDLASFIEDIRRDVSPDLTDVLISRFCEKAMLKDDADFRAAYAVMGAQRNTKLLGFPIRADLKFGKPQYRALMPRIKRHFQNSLSHPVLADVKAWFEKNIPEALI